jgi:hypothetical protein
MVAANSIPITPFAEFIAEPDAPLGTFEDKSIEIKLLKILAVPLAEKDVIVIPFAIEPGVALCPGYKP